MLFCAASTNLQAKRWDIIVCTTVLSFLSPLPHLKEDTHVFLYLLPSTNSWLHRAPCGSWWHTKLLQAADVLPTEAESTLGKSICNGQDILPARQRTRESVEEKAAAATAELVGSCSRSPFPSLPFPSRPLPHTGHLRSPSTDAPTAKPWTTRPSQLFSSSFPLTVEVQGLKRKTGEKG